MGPCTCCIILTLLETVVDVKEAFSAPDHQPPQGERSERECLSLFVFISSKEGSDETMAQTLGLRPTEAGPSSFATSQDFISFDDFDGDAAGNNDLGESDAVSLEAEGPLDDFAHQDPGASLKASGKKRKQDDRVESDGKTKRERKREVARGTPWCEHVDFDNCITSADV